MTFREILSKYCMKKKTNLTELELLRALFANCYTSYRVFKNKFMSKLHKKLEKYFQPFPAIVTNFSKFFCVRQSFIHTTFYRLFLSMSKTYVMFY